jgi:hypothetical protein
VYGDFVLELKRKIVYRGHNIRGTDIVDPLKYFVTPYHPDIPEPTGLSIFIKGLAELEIDKSLIVNGPFCVSPQVVPSGYTISC